MITSSHLHATSRSIPEAIVYGARGYALGWSEWLEEPIDQPRGRVIAFIDDLAGDQGLSNNGVPVITLEAAIPAFSRASVFVAVGAPASRRQIAERVSRAGGLFLTYDHIAGGWAADALIEHRVFTPTGAAMWQEGRIGEGSILSHVSPVGARTRVGRHLNLMHLASIGADCTIGDFVTICPMSAIGDRVVVEAGAFIGVGAQIVNTSPGTLTIGAGATLAGGAVVRESVPAGATVAGDPAADLRTLAKRRRVNREDGRGE